MFVYLESSDMAINKHTDMVGRIDVKDIMGLIFFQTANIILMRATNPVLTGFIWMAFKQTANLV
jgi:hypothetical protein